jgi:hypothetical protein
VSFVQVAFGQLNRQDELQQEVEKYKPLTRLTRRLSKIGEITWMGQDVKTSLETIKKVRGGGGYNACRST